MTLYIYRYHCLHNTDTVQSFSLVAYKYWESGRYLLLTLTESQWECRSLKAQVGTRPHHDWVHHCILHTQSVLSPCQLRIVIQHLRISLFISLTLFLLFLLTAIWRVGHFDVEGCCVKINCDSDHFFCSTSFCPKQLSAYNNEGNETYEWV